jgi:sorbitol-specific phosphotransferase system component IIBC
MPVPFLSDEWFSQVDSLIAAAGDLQIPPAMKAVEVNVTVTSPTGDIALFLQDGLFVRGHRPSAVTSLTLSSALARKIFIEGDAAAGVQAFMTGEMKAEGDLSKLVAMQTLEPSRPQQELQKKIAAITA